MKQTAQFGLNQWERTDRVLMDDFNNDNKKIDAALASKLGPREMIKTMSLPIATSFDLDLSDIDWSQWDQVQFILDIVTVGSAEPADIYCQAKTSNVSARQYCSSDASYFACAPFMPFQLTLLPHHDATRKVQACCIGKYANIGIVECEFSQLLSLHFSATNDQFFHNTQSLTLWGVR